MVELTATDFTYLLHLVADFSPDDYDRALRVNAEGTGFVLEHCRHAKAALVMSTVTVYKPHPDPWHAFREDDAGLARRLRAALTWVRDQAAMVPIPLGEPNSVSEPYPVPTVTHGLAAGDAAYAMGSFELGEDQALVVRGRSPACAFWNLCLWNPFLHTYNYD